MYGGRTDCCILAVLINVIILFASNYSAEHSTAEKTKCNMQYFYSAFTTTDIQNIQQKDATLHTLFTNTTNFSPALMLQNYLQVPKNEKDSPENTGYQLLLQNCSHQKNICIKYIIQLHADDCILDPSNYYIYYKRRKRIYLSTIPYIRQSEFLFKINTQKTHFIYLNNRLNLLFCEQIGSEATYNVFHYRLKTRSCILRTKISMPYIRLKRSAYQLESGRRMLIIIALVITVFLSIILIFLLIVIVTHCCCQNNRIMEDELPKSLIENCRRAEPPPEEEGKYLPELFDASAFQFKGPIVIEYPKSQIFKHELINEKPIGSNINDHVRFDENLNVAYDIGENVEIIVKSYGQGIKTGSTGMIKDGKDDNEATNDSEKDSRQLITENKKKETVKYPKIQKTKVEEKKDRAREVAEWRKHSEPVSALTQKTQPSRYSDSSTQTLKVDGESVISLKKYSETHIEQATPVAAKSRNTMLTRDGPSSSDVTDITPALHTVKPQLWVDEETSFSISGSSRNQNKNCNTFNTIGSG